MPSRNSVNGRKAAAFSRLAEGGIQVATTRTARDINRRLNGQLFRGFSGMAGEFGPVAIQENGEVCFQDTLAYFQFD